MRNFWAEERVRRVVRRQHGRVSWAQLVALGASRATISRSVADGRLIRVMPRVYAVGHATAALEGRLWEALLFAGPGAVISHRSAAHWRELIRYAPAVIEVSTPLRTRSLPGLVRVHNDRNVIRATHNGLPATTTAQTLLDLAAAQPGLLRHALSQLDFRRELDTQALHSACGSGKRGSSALRQALAHHQPLLARANSKLEIRFIDWCERWQVPLPQVNVDLHGEIVDAYWPQYGLVVELDSYVGHGTPAQQKRDRARDLHLRAYGLRVLRYDWDLLHTQPAALHADLTAHMHEND